MVCFREMNDARHVFGARIKSLRKARCLTQSQLGSIVGLDRTRISRLESGQTSVKFDTILLLAYALDVTASELFNGVDYSRVTVQELPISFGFPRREWKNRKNRESNS